MSWSTPATRKSSSTRSAWASAERRPSCRASWRNSRRRPARELRPVYREIEQELRSQYLLAYNSNQEGAGDAFRPVQVRVAGGRRARTMSGYYP